MDKAAAQSNNNNNNNNNQKSNKKKSNNNNNNQNAQLNKNNNNNNAQLKALLDNVAAELKNKKKSNNNNPQSNPDAHKLLNPGNDIGMRMLGFYLSLGLDVNATDAQIKKAVRQWKRKNHPDIFSDGEGKAKAEKEYKDMDQFVELLKRKFKKKIGGKFKKYKSKKTRKHRGIIQTGGNKGKLRKGYKYSGKRLKNGTPEILKIKSVKK